VILDLPQPKLVLASNHAAVPVLTKDLEWSGARRSSENQEVHNVGAPHPLDVEDPVLIEIPVLELVESGSNTGLVDAASLPPLDNVSYGLIR
jgi:hypothetical protein